MTATLACITGEEFFRQQRGGRLAARSLGTRSTPFGTSSEVFLVEGESPFYIMPRHGEGIAKVPAAAVNYRANFYALKDLGVVQVLEWAPAGAITHNIAVGDLAIVDDVIDQTRLRTRTFFESSPLGFVRQFPVFCPGMRQLVGSVLHGMKLVHHSAVTAAVSEGPRLETAAEIRMLSSAGAQIVTHHFAPSVFLAKELELCYCGVAYVVNYAETGSRHRPFAAGELFGGLSIRSDRQRLDEAVGAMGELLGKIAESLKGLQRTCECAKFMEHARKTYALGDWRTYVKPQQ